MTPAKPGPSLHIANPVAQAKAVLRKKFSADDAAVTSRAGHEPASQPVTAEAPGEASAMNVGDAGASYQSTQASVPAAGASTSASTSAAASPAATTSAAAPVLVNDMVNPWLTGGAVLTDASATPAVPAAPEPAAVAAPVAAAADAPAVAVPAGPDTIAPTLAITSNVAALKAGQTATVTFTFSEAPVGFAAGDISTIGGTLSNPAVSTTDPKVYTATFTPTAGAASATGLITVAPGQYTDAAGNSGGAATTPALAIDTLAPAAPVIFIDPTSDIINGMGVFHQLSGISESGATVALTIAGTTHAATVTTIVFNGTRDVWSYTLTAADIAAMGQGAETITVTQTDAAGNTSVAGTHDFMVDTIAPVFTSVGANIHVAENAPIGTIVFDGTANGDAGVTYSLAGGMDVFQFSIDATTGVVRFDASPNFEFAVDIGANHVYDLTINATDAAGNVTGQAVQVTVTDVLESNQAGDAIIDLGSYGNLIHPVQVEGKWYYIWDRNGDGAANSSRSLNGGFDYMTHNVLDDLFNYDINGVRNTTVMNNADGGFGTTDNFRYATINGVKLALPTAGGVIGPNGSSHYYPGTAVGDGAGINPTYDDLLAIWDAYNGTATTIFSNGTPAGWQAGVWSASVGNQLGHALVELNTGSVNGIADALDGYVVLQVL